MRQPHVRRPFPSVHRGIPSRDARRSKFNRTRLGSPGFPRPLNDGGPCADCDRRYFRTAVRPLHSGRIVPTAGQRVGRPWVHLDIFIAAQRSESSLLGIYLMFSPYRNHRLSAPWCSIACARQTRRMWMAICCDTSAPSDATSFCRHGYADAFIGVGKLPARFRRTSDLVVIEHARPATGMVEPTHCHARAPWQTRSGSFHPPC